MNCHDAKKILNNKSEDIFSEYDINEQINAAISNIEPYVEIKIFSIDVADKIVNAALVLGFSSYKNYDFEETNIITISWE